MSCASAGALCLHGQLWVVLQRHSPPVMMRMSFSLQLCRDARSFLAVVQRRKIFSCNCAVVQGFSLRFCRVAGYCFGNVGAGLRMIQEKSLQRRFFERWRDDLETDSYRNESDADGHLSKSDDHCHLMIVNSDSHFRTYRAMDIDSR